MADLLNGDLRLQRFLCFIQPFKPLLDGVDTDAGLQGIQQVLNAPLGIGKLLFEAGKEQDALYLGAP